jgi:hypothetical protein
VGGDAGVAALSDRSLRGARRSPGSAQARKQVAPAEVVQLAAPRSIMEPVDGTM